MRFLGIAFFTLFVCAGAIRADDVVAEVQQALKDQGFYYGQINGEKNADTTAAIRRYQIRNGLPITGELDDATLKALRSISPSSSRPAVANAPATTPATAASPARTQEETAAASAAPEQPPSGPRESQSAAGTIRRGEESYPSNVPNAPSVAGQPGDLFADTPFENASPEQQHDVVVSAQRTLAGRGLYHGEIDGVFAPPLEFALRAYQSKVGLPVTGRLDLETLAGLKLLPGANAPVYRPRRRVPPVRGEWIHP
jgi:peptidoglycan hydrolase-like protein with peptidoglycan-binding domain